MNTWFSTQFLKNKNIKQHKQTWSNILYNDFLFPNGNLNFSGFYRIVDYNIVSFYER